MELTYKAVIPMARSEALLELESADRLRKAQALLAIAMFEPDWRWAQNLCLQILASDEKNLEEIAVTCLGHIARINGQIDKDRVLPVLAALLQNPEIAGVAQDVLEDIEIFVGE